MMGTITRYLVGLGLGVAFASMVQGCHDCEEYDPLPLDGTWTLDSIVGAPDLREATMEIGATEVTIDYVNRLGEAGTVVYEITDRDPEGSYDSRP